MGLLDLLTKEIKLTSAVMHWAEPWMFRVRLRNDLPARLLIILGAWLGSAGVLLLLFALSANPPGALLALGLGLIGAGSCYAIVLGRKPQVSGSCWMYGDKLSWQSTSAGFAGLQGNWAEWDYDTIDRCVVVPSEHLGKPFSVMLLVEGSDELLIGIPNSVNLKEVAKLLTKMNVNVAVAQHVPSRYTSPMPLPLGIAAPVAGLVLMGVGLLAGVLNPDGQDKDKRAIRRPDMPQLESSPPEFSHIEMPGSGRNQPQSQPQTSDSASANALPPADSGLAPGSFADFSSRTGFGPGRGMPTAPGISPDGGQVNASPAANSIHNAPASAVVGTDSELLGGAGGGPFRTVDPNGRPIVAVQYAIGAWAGKERVGRLIPMAIRPPATSLPQLIVAKEGYAVGAMEVDAGDLVDAIRLVFMRTRADGSLDKEDSYASEWIGTPNEANVRTISGEGSPVIGIHGRGAAVLDAVGLVFAKARR